MDDLLLDEAPLDLDQHIAAVNSNPKATWIAGTNAKFAGASKKEVKEMLGAIVDPEWTINLAPKTASNNNSTSHLPLNFDARTNWPFCRSVINHERDQSNCGSCWAHGTTEAFNDRLCIATGGKFIIFCRRQTRLGAAILVNVTRKGATGVRLEPPGLGL